MSKLASAAAAALVVGGLALIPVSDASAAVVVHRGFVHPHGAVVRTHGAFVRPHGFVARPVYRPFVRAGAVAPYPAYGWGYPGYWGGAGWGAPAWHGAAWRPGWGVGWGGGWGRPVWRAGWGGGMHGGWGYRGGWRRF